MKNTEMPMVRIYQNDGTYIDREMNAEEIAQAEIDTANLQIRQAEAEAKAQAKTVAEGKLAALGLTTNDLRALGL